MEGGKRTRLIDGASPSPLPEFPTEIAQ